jgi:hypothetical protein
MVLKKHFQYAQGTSLTKINGPGLIRVRPGFITRLYN